MTGWRAVAWCAALTGLVAFWLGCLYLAIELMKR